MQQGPPSPRQILISFLTVFGIIKFIDFFNCRAILLFVPLCYKMQPYTRRLILIELCTVFGLEDSEDSFCTSAPEIPEDNMGTTLPLLDADGWVISGHYQQR